MWPGTARRLPRWVRKCTRCSGAVSTPSTTAACSRASMRNSSARGSTRWPPPPSPPTIHPPGALRSVMPAILRGGCTVPASNAGAGSTAPRRRPVRTASSTCPSARACPRASRGADSSCSSETGFSSSPTASSRRRRMRATSSAKPALKDCYATAVPTWTRSIAGCSLRFAHTRAAITSRTTTSRSFSGRSCRARAGAPARRGAARPCAG
jgi:hypothetical protein